LGLEIKTGAIAMPLIEEKTGFGSFRLSGQTLRTPRNRCARCENCFTPRSQPATIAMLLHNRAGPGIENNMVPL
jgi:hypothetical protein